MTEKHSEHTVHIYWHKIGKRFTQIRHYSSNQKQKVMNEHNLETRGIRYDPSRAPIMRNQGPAPHHVVIFKSPGYTARL